MAIGPSAFSCPQVITSKSLACFGFANYLLLWDNGLSLLLLGFAGEVTHLSPLPFSPLSRWILPCCQCMLIFNFLRWIYASPLLWLHRFYSDMLVFCTHFYSWRSLLEISDLSPSRLHGELYSGLFLHYHPGVPMASLPWWIPFSYMPYLFLNWFVPLRKYTSSSSCLRKSIFEINLKFF